MIPVHAAYNRYRCTDTRYPCPLCTYRYSVLVPPYRCTSTNTQYQVLLTSDCLLHRIHIFDEGTRVRFRSTHISRFRETHRYLRKAPALELLKGNHPQNRQSTCDGRGRVCVLNTQYLNFMSIVRCCCLTTAVQKCPYHTQSRDKIPLCPKM